jgi:hypothetical protein
MLNFRSIGQVDVKPLLESIDLNADLWNEFPDRLMGANAIQETKFDDIWVHMAQSITEMTPDEQTECLKHGPYINPLNYWRTAYYRLPVKSILNTLFDHVDGQAYGRVFISRLPPGAEIFPHIDVDILHFARFHVALSHDLDQLFMCGDEIYSPKLGEIFWFNNSVMHSVINNSDKPRLSMIVDIQTPWLKLYKETI